MQLLKIETIAHGCVNMDQKDIEWNSTCQWDRKIMFVQYFTALESH
jgi:hypothetical protein